MSNVMIKRYLSVLYQFPQYSPIMLEHMANDKRKARECTHTLLSSSKGGLGKASQVGHCFSFEVGREESVEYMDEDTGWKTNHSFCSLFCSLVRDMVNGQNQLDPLLHAWSCFWKRLCRFWSCWPIQSIIFCVNATFLPNIWAWTAIP